MLVVFNTVLSMYEINDIYKMFIAQVNFKITFQQDHIMLCE